jgi:hypothetical protein
MDISTDALTVELKLRAQSLKSPGPGKVSPWRNSAGNVATWLTIASRRWLAEHCSRTPARQIAHLEGVMFWLGGVYNVCWVHTTLTGTPTLAADLTAHVWSVDELRRHRVQRD